jgi:hypothetical protein
MDYSLPSMGPTKLISYMSTSKSVLFINYLSFPKVGDYVHVKVGSVIELFSISGCKKYYVVYEIRCKVLNGNIIHVLNNHLTGFRPVRSETFRLPDVTSGSSTSRSPYLPSGRSNNTNRGKPKKQCIYYIYARDDSNRQCRNFATDGSNYCHVHNNRP